VAKVFLYRNLHKKCWSVKYKGLVVAHAPRLFAWDCKFWVNPGGNERVRKEKRKNVHAYVACEPDDLMVPEGTEVKGDLDLMEFSLLKKMGETNEKQITYQPYKMKTFQEVESEKPIFEATHVYLTARGSVYVHDDTVIKSKKKKKIPKTSQPTIKSRMGNSPNTL